MCNHTIPFMETTLKLLTIVNQITEVTILPLFDKDLSAKLRLELLLREALLTILVPYATQICPKIAYIAENFQITQELFAFYHSNAQQTFIQITVIFTKTSNKNQILQCYTKTTQFISSLSLFQTSYYPNFNKNLEEVGWNMGIFIFVN